MSLSLGVAQARQIWNRQGSPQTDISLVAHRTLETYQKGKDDHIAEAPHMAHRKVIDHKAQLSAMALESLEEIIPLSRAEYTSGVRKTKSTLVRLAISSFPSV